MTYTSYQRRFTPEYIPMVEAQIENSLDYWAPEDIIIATNFPYEYKGIKSIVFPGNFYSIFHKMASKPGIIAYLLENKIIDELTWVHDFDAFQLTELNPPEITHDLALTSYGFKPEINTGSMFFKPEALDIFKLMWDRTLRYQTFDEMALQILIDHNVNYINSRIQMLDQTFNIGIRCTKTIYRDAEKPIRVVHFPPYDQRWMNKMSIFLPDKLRKILDEKLHHLRQSGQGIQA